MPRFAIRYPYLIIVICLMAMVIGATCLVRMPVDLFPEIKVPVVVVATFYPGMPPEQIEQDLTARLERFLTLAGGIDHIESRSLPGTSLIKIYFQPGTSADSAVSTVGNLAMAELRRLPPGTLPPVVLKFDASSQPVCLITLKGEGMNESELRDVGHYKVRTQVAVVPGAALPQPFGGRYRQIMVYVDPLKLEAHQLSLMDVVRSINDANAILPAGDVRVGPFDYNIYANSEVERIPDIAAIPLKTIGQSSVLVGDVAETKDSSQIQYNMVRVDGQRSAYVPVLKQGGDANTIAIVNGVRETLKKLVDVPKQLVTQVVFDQSKFVKNAVENLLHEGGIGLILTAVMILVFLGSMRATAAVFLSIPLSALATFIALALAGGTVNTMILGGLALAFSRLIDNSVVVLENIFRHLELGESPEVAAEQGGQEVALPVLAATLTTSVVFFPVVFLYGASRYLFMALASAVVLSLLASYLVAMAVVPLFCAKLIRAADAHAHGHGNAKGFNAWFNRKFASLLDWYEGKLRKALVRPAVTLLGCTGIFLLSLGLWPFIGTAFFPRTDPGQFFINIKAQSGTRLEVSEKIVEKVENICRAEVTKDDLDLIVSNIGITPDFSAIYNANTAQHTAIVQVSLKEHHHTGSYEYMDRVRRRVRTEVPEITAYFQSGGLVDAVLNLGQPAPIDIQVSGSNLAATHKTATDIARQLSTIPGVSDTLIPQDMDYPGLRITLDRKRISELGTTARDVISNMDTALLSNAMIAPTFWTDPKSGNDYFLTVQYPEGYLKDFDMLRAIPIRAPGMTQSTRLDVVADIKHISGPTEIAHYQLRRVIHLYVAPAKEDVLRVMKEVKKILAHTTVPEGASIDIRGSVESMSSSFRTFGYGLILSIALVYLVLVAQFKSFLDPFLILLAVPTGLTGVLVALWVTGTTLNVMSLMGIVMMVGIVVSDSILIVQFVRQLQRDGEELYSAIVTACRVRLRPILMTSLATLIGLLPMALKFGTGSEAYAPLARAIIGGLGFSAVFTLFVVPAACLVAERRGKSTPPASPGGRAGSGGIPRRSMKFLRLPAILASVLCLPIAQGANFPRQLTLKEAHDIALRKHPKVTIAHLLALAGWQAVDQARSGYFPNVSLNIAGVDTARENTRSVSPGVQVSTVVDRGGAGVFVSQLLTDFGRTSNLVASTKLKAKSQEQNVEATKAQLLLEVDDAYFAVLRSQSLVRVAQDTVTERRLIRDQVGALAQNELRSSLDVSFAEVSLQQAELLLSRTENDLASACATLAALLDETAITDYQLADQSGSQKPDTNVSDLIATAFRNRPDLLRLGLERDSAVKFAKAEGALSYPRITAEAVAGELPYHDAATNQDYAAGGIEVNWPVFNGKLFTAKRKEAELRAQADEEAIHDARNNVERDVRIAWLSANNAYKNLAITSKLRQQAKRTLDLATARYNAGTSGMVELSQAQLALTSADIDETSARYEYRLRLSILAYQTGSLR